MIKNGIDNRMNYAAMLKKARIGLVTNPSGVTLDLKSSADILARDFNLTVLFGPEHGIRGCAQAGMAVEDDRDPILGIPVFSLHGKRQRIPEESYDMFDVIAYDIQDVGARFYTYMTTLSYVMEDAARIHKPVVVFDRVNPLGGALAEGILLDTARFSGFVGRYPIPARYALTIGEFARYINDFFGIGCDLTVIPCDNHPRSLQFPETGQLWISPSPNIPTYETALAYIGTCIFEATNVSEGRGTTHPFEMVGAPFIDADKLANSLESHRLPGIVWRPVHFTPMFSKHANTPCHGVQLHIKDRHAASFVEAGLRLFDEIRKQNGDALEVNAPTFSILFGDDAYLTGHESIEQTIQRAQSNSAAFQNAVGKYLLYG